MPVKNRKLEVFIQNLFIESIMSSDEKPPIEERIDTLEQELKTAKKQIERLTEELIGTIAINCLPLPQSKKLAIGFKMLKILPQAPLIIIIKRYVAESRMSNLSFDEMINPIVNELGFERAWKVLSHETIKDVYGDWDLNRWKEMAKSHPCED